MQQHTSNPNNPNPPQPPAFATYGQYGVPFDPYGMQGSLLDNPARLLRILLKSWLTIFLCLAFAGAAALFYLATATRIYEARTLIELSVRRPRILSQQGALIDDPTTAGSNEEIFNTRLERFRGRRVMQVALNNILVHYPEAFLTEEDKDLPAEQVSAIRLNRLMTRINLSLMRRTRILQVTFSDADPVFAAAVCNAFAEAARDSAFDENRVSSDAAVAWLEAQETTQREALQQADRNLLAFITESDLDTRKSQRRTVEEAMISFNKSLVEVESQMARENDLLQTLQTLEVTPEDAGSMPSFIPHAAELREGLAKWRSAIQEREQLLIRYTPQHPEVIAIDQLISQHRNQVRDTIAEAKATTQANRDLLARQTQTLRERIQSEARLATQLDAEIATGQTQITSLERMREASDQAYRGILLRIQDARLAADEDTASVNIFEPATVPRSPAKPRPLIILALAIIIGLGASIAIIILREILQDRVADTEDLTPWGLSVLALVPRVKVKSRSELAKASLLQKHSQVTEAFAGLRAMLDSPQFKAQSQVVLIASSLPGEGKTVTSCNLASAWAGKGRRVLLLDFDLRRPQLARIFPMPTGHIGLLQALVDDPELQHGEQITYPAKDCPNLHIIATRPLSGASPAEIAGTTAVERLIAWARANYDHIVIDAPPLGLVGDALALAPLADTTLIMVRPTTSRKRVTRHTIQRFQESGLQHLALVVNDVDFKHFGYGSYSTYYNTYHTENAKHQKED